MISRESTESTENKKNIEGSDLNAILSEQFQALIDSLNSIKINLKCFYDPKDHGFYESLFIDSKSIKNFELYLNSVKDLKVNLQPLVLAFNSLQNLCQPMAIKIESLDIYIQDYIIQPICNFHKEMNHISNIEENTLDAKNLEDLENLENLENPEISDNPDTEITQPGQKETDFWRALSGIWRDLPADMLLQIFSYVNPEVLFLLSKEQINFDNIFWANAYKKQLPHLTKTITPNMTTYSQFHADYNNDYKLFTKNEKELLFAIQTSNLESLILLQNSNSISIEMLNKKDKKDKTIFDWALQINDKHILSFIYDLVKKYYYDGIINKFDTIKIDNPDDKKTILYWMVACQRLDALVELLAQIDEPEAQRILLNQICHKSKKNAIHLAAMYGALDIFNFLIEQDACFIEKMDGCMQTPLLWAAARGQQAIVDCLIGLRADLNVTTISSGIESINFGKSPLDWAITNGHEQIAIKLINAGIYVKAVSGLGKSQAIHWAAQNGFINIVRLLIENYTELLNQANDFGATPLHLAAKHGHLDIVNYLIGQGTNLNSEINKNSRPNQGKTPLYLAIENKNSQVAIALLDAGACIAHNLVLNLIPDTHLAARLGLLDVLGALIKYHPQAFRESAYFYEQTCFMIHSAIFSKKIEAVKMILEHFPEQLEVKDSHGCSPLLLTVYEMSHSNKQKAIELIKYFLSKNANVNLEIYHPNNYKHARTILYLAIQYNLPLEIITQFIEMGSPLTVNLENQKFLSSQPIHLAIQYSQFDTAKMLIEKKPEVIKHLDKDGKTPLFYAYTNEKFFDYFISVIKQEDLNVVIGGEAHQHHGKSLLYIAIEAEQYKIANKLFKAGALAIAPCGLTINMPNMPNNLFIQHHNVEALNHAQKNQIKGMMNLLFISLEKAEPAYVYLALEAAINPDGFQDTINKLNNCAKDIWLKIKTIQDIFYHPWPQNMNEHDYSLGLPADPLLISYINYKGDLLSEAKGLLSLTISNNDSVPPVTKEAVINYITHLVQEKMAAKLKQIESLALKKWIIENGVLNLSEEKLSKANVLYLCAFLHNNSGITQVSLNLDCLDIEDTVKIDNALKNLPSFKYLVLYTGKGNNLKGFGQCLEALSYLSLHGNIADDDIASLVVPIQKNSVLSQLKINAHCDYQVNPENEKLKFHTKIPKSGDYLADKGGLAIAEMLVNKPQLKSLNINSGAIGNAGGIAIANAIIANKLQLSSLEIMGHLMNDEVGFALAKAIKKMPSLTFLTVEGHYLNNFPLIAIANVLAYTQCKVLALGGYYLNDNGVIAIAKALHGHPHLTSLYISGGYVGNSLKLGLKPNSSAKAIVCNTALTTINLQGNYITPQDKDILKEKDSKIRIHYGREVGIRSFIRPTLARLSFFEFKQGDSQAGGQVNEQVRDQVNNQAQTKCYGFS